MKTNDEILNECLERNDCVGYLSKDGRLYKAVIEALNYKKEFLQASQDKRKLDSDEVSKSVCLANRNYADCHIHSDNVDGCIGCGNFETDY